jgi:integrase
VPIPTWTKNAIDAWTSVASVAEGHMFRPITRGDQVRGERLSEKVVWQMLKLYVARIGVPHVAPHDLRRYAECGISGAQRRNCAGRPAANWNRFKCCSDIRLCRRLNAT